MELHGAFGEAAKELRARIAPLPAVPETVPFKSEAQRLAFPEGPSTPMGASELWGWVVFWGPYMRDVGSILGATDSWKLPNIMA